MEIRNVLPTLSEGDPIKVLALNYLMSITEPEFNFTSEGYAKFKEVLSLMLDIAYRFGVYEAIGCVQQVVRETGQTNGVPILDIRDVCSIVEDYNKERKPKKEIELPTAEDLMKWES